MSRPAWWANDKGWWRCDSCGDAINPKWKRGTPTPEVPIGNRVWACRPCADILRPRPLPLEPLP